MIDLLLFYIYIDLFGIFGKSYSDICKLRVALVRQEMLTRSGAPDFICLSFGWRIHFAISFLPLLAFQPLLAKYKSSMSEYMVSHVSDAFIFTFLYFHVVCFHVRHCLGTGW